MQSTPRRLSIVASTSSADQRSASIQSPEIDPDHWQKWSLRTSDAWEGRESASRTAPRSTPTDWLTPSMGLAFFQHFSSINGSSPASRAHT